MSDSNKEIKNLRASVAGKIRTLKRGESIIKNFMQFYMLDFVVWDQHEKLFIEWFSQKIEVLTPSTRIRNRQWLSAYLESIGQKELSNKIRLLGAKQKAHKKFHIENRKGRLTEDISKDDLFLLTDTLRSAFSNNRPRYKDGDLIAIWVFLAVMTGIRPSEWFGVNVLSGIVDEDGAIYKMVLQVPTANKGGRSKSDVGSLKRHLVLDAWNERDIALLKVFLEMLPSDQDGFNRFRIHAQNTVQKASQYTFNDGKRFSLYTCRHLYASEFRRLPGSTKFRLAAALGHSDIINQLYYGDVHNEENEERRFTFNLALPLMSEARDVFNTASSRNERSRERIFKRFGSRPKNLRFDDVGDAW